MTTWTPTRNMYFYHFCDLIICHNFHDFLEIWHYFWWFPWFLRFLSYAFQQFSIIPVISAHFCDIWDLCDFFGSLNFSWFLVISHDFWWLPWFLWFLLIPMIANDFPSFQWFLLISLIFRISAISLVPFHFLWFLVISGDFRDSCDIFDSLTSNSCRDMTQRSRSLRSRFAGYI